MQKEDLYLSIARVEGLGRGVAFLIEKFTEPINGAYGLWFTCTHVCGEEGELEAYVSTDDDYPNFEIPILLKRDQCFPTDENDLSLLYSPEPLPDHIKPLMTDNERNSLNHKISLYGFPDDSKIDGIPEDDATLRSTRSRDSRKNPQLLFKSISVSAGFSGSPIYDNHKKAVIGIVTEVANKDNIERRGNSVFGIPLSFIGKVFPQLGLYSIAPVSKKRISHTALTLISESQALERLSQIKSMDDMTVEEKMERAAHLQKLRERILGNAETDQEKHIPVLLFYKILSGQKILKNDRKDLGFLVKDKDTPWHQKSMVANALTISLIGQFDATRLDYLLDFVFEEEDRVWQHALVGIVLGLFQREGILRKDHSGLLNKLKGLKTKDKIQIGIKHLMQHLNNIKFEEYEQKTVLYKQLKAKIEQEVPAEVQQPILTQIREELSTGDPIFRLYLILNDFKKDIVFHDPHFWLLPFYKGNTAVRGLLNLKSDLVPVNTMENLLFNSTILSNSQKYAFCYHYDQLSDCQIKRIGEIFSDGKRKLDELAADDYREAEAINNSIFRNILSDIYQFQLFFPQERLAQLLEYNFQLQTMPLTDLITKQQVQIDIEVERLLNLGNALYKKGQLDQAIQQYRKAIQLNPNDATAYNNLGNALYKKGQLDQAILQYRKAIQLNPNDATAYNNLGNALYKKGQLDQAILQFRKAIQLNPNYATAYNNLGNALSDKGQLDQAILQYRKAIQLNPNYATAYNNLGNALSDKGQLDQAILQYRKAIQLNPNYVTAYNNLGIALSDKRQLDRAILQYRKAIQLNPNYATAYNNLGNALSDKGQLDQAIQQFRKAIQLNPNDATAYNNLGIAYLTLGEVAEAESIYKVALNLDSENGMGLMNYGHLLLAKGDETSAIEYYTSSRDKFTDKNLFFVGMAADYHDFKLHQYGIEQAVYDGIVEQLRFDG